MKVFSFCLYGTEPNYYTGLLENIAIVKEHYPDFTIVVHKGACDPNWVIPEGVDVNNTNRVGAINALLRYLSLCTAEVGFVRDTDSRITARDRWCIDEFLKSNKSYHSIRDHYWHRSKLMAGTFGWKKPLPLMMPTHEVGYGFDEHFLATEVYDRVKSDLLVHTSYRAFVGEHAVWIERPFEDTYDFVGNVIWDGKPKFTYTRDIPPLLAELRKHDQFAILLRVLEGVDPWSIPYGSRTEVFEIAYTACYYLGKYEEAQRWLSYFEFADVTSQVVVNSNFLIGHLGTIVASFDPNRTAKESEVVIVYGNFPDGHLALPATRTMYRHVSLFSQIRHAVVESHPCWDSVDIIYILNLEGRSDRYMETLASLSRVAAPLHKVHHYIGTRDLPPYVGATKNHVDVIRHFQQSTHSTCLIVEDDIVFTDDTERVQSSIQSFFQRSYDYSICFLSLSRLGDRRPHDELLSESKQFCTTSAAYFLTKRTSHDVLAVVDEGLRKITAGEGYQNEGCIDTYWCGRLPHLYFFKNKLAFQRPSYSNLKKCVVAYLD
jgi:GR25 family glycosyltransferase involved in LPS biosynthesis